MPRSIGGDGLEQGGPELGNEISRKDLSIKNAGDALTDLPTMSGKKDDENADLDDDIDLDDDSLLADDELEEDDEDDVIDDDDTALIPDGEDEDDEEEDKNL